MAFFLETLLGGLMAGMLYSLVALGFVLIFKASGVFNFAQGAMVLFAALAMARFAEWVPKWTGTSNTMVATALAFLMAGAVMFLVAWLIERLVLRHLVNQEGTTLLMATLGITYLLEGLGQTIFGSDIYKIDIGMPKDPVFLFQDTFQGGILVSLEDVYAAIVAALLLVFTISFDNITASMFWRPSGVETMPTQILSMLKVSISPEINALGTLMIIVTVGLPLLGGGLARYLARSGR